MVNDNSSAMMYQRLDQFGEISETVDGGLKSSGVLSRCRSRGAGQGANEESVY